MENTPMQTQTADRQERTDPEPRAPDLTREVARVTANGADGDLLSYEQFDAVVASAEATIRRLTTPEADD
jgi:hypothetical protein